MRAFLEGLMVGFFLIGMPLMVYSLHTDLTRIADTIESQQPQEYNVNLHWYAD